MTLNCQKSDNAISKAELRRVIQRKIDEICLSDVLESDRRIFKMLTNLPEFESAKVVFCYVSTKGEINTGPMIASLLERGDGTRVAVPKCVSHGIMEARVISGFYDMTVGKYGIMEPDNGCLRLTQGEIDLVIAPCVTCDFMCNRLGHGGGYYDRYLSAGNAAGRAYTTAALCRDALMCESVPIDPGTDQPVDIVVTETRVIRIRDL